MNKYSCFWRLHGNTVKGISSKTTDAGRLNYLSTECQTKGARSVSQNFRKLYAGWQRRLYWIECHLHNMNPTYSAPRRWLAGAVRGCGNFMVHFDVKSVTA